MSVDTTAQTIPTDLPDSFNTTVNTVLAKIRAMKDQYFTKNNILEFSKTIPGRILMITMGVMLFVFLFSMFHSNSKSASANSTRSAFNTPADAAMVSAEMNQVGQRVANSNHLTQIEIQQMKSQIQVLQQNLQQLTDQNVLKQVSQSIAQSNEQLTQKINDLASNMNEVKQSIQPHTYLDPKMLPFKVTAVDIWGGHPYATVELDSKEDLIGINESRAGWTVNAIDFSARTIEFKNEKDQYIKIQLEN